MSYFGYPYTNFHELNADWLLSTVKKDAESNAELKATTDALRKKVETDLSSQNTKINDLQRTTNARLNTQDAKIAENNASEVQLINKWGADLRKETTEKIDNWGENLYNHITQVGKDNTSLINKWGESVPTYVNSYLNDYKESGELSDAIIASIANLGYANIFTYRNVGFIVPDKWNIDIIKNALISGRVNNFAGKSIFSNFNDRDFSTIDSGATDIVIMTNYQPSINDISTITNYLTSVKEYFPNATLHMVSPFVDDNIQYQYKEFYSLMMWKICQKCDVCYMDITFNDIFPHTDGFHNTNTGGFVDNRMLSELIISKVVTYANERPKFKPVSYSQSNNSLATTFGITLNNISVVATKTYTLIVKNNGVYIQSGAINSLYSENFNSISIDTKSIYDIETNEVVTGMSSSVKNIVAYLLPVGNTLNLFKSNLITGNIDAFDLNIKLSI